jgi:hypothetical protein
VRRTSSDGNGTGWIVQAELLEQQKIGVGFLSKIKIRTSSPCHGRRPEVLATSMKEIALEVKGNVITHQD